MVLKPNREYQPLNNKKREQNAGRDIQNKYYVCVLDDPNYLNITSNSILY